MGTRRVVGLSYDPGDSAPVVVVKGAGEAAESVLQRARQEDVPVVREPALAAELYRVPVDTSIGKDLFPVVAALLVHVLRLDAKLREQESQIGETQ